MTLDEIKAAVEEGHRVYWQDEGYEVIKDTLGQWFIQCLQDGHCIGLTWTDETTMNGKPEDFFLGHMWGGFEASLIGGNCRRKCQIPGCKEITLDGDDMDGDDE